MKKILIFSFAFLPLVVGAQGPDPNGCSGNAITLQLGTCSGDGLALTSSNVAECAENEHTWYLKKDNGPWVELTDEEEKSLSTTITSNGVYRVYCYTEMVCPLDGVPTDMFNHSCSAPLTVTSFPPSGYNVLCGEEWMNSSAGCTSNIDIMQIGSQYLVVAKDQGLIVKVSSLNGTGDNMFNLSATNPTVAGSGATYLLGSQSFSSAITDIEYTSTGYLLIGFSDGKFLKLSGAGGSGSNMYALTETSTDFGPLAGFTSGYVGHHKFQSAVVDLAYIDGRTFLTFSNKKILKINGAGGTGGNVFAITETSTGFVTVPGFSYYEGSAMYSGKCNFVQKIGSNLCLFFDNGKVLEINGTIGGTGDNFMAVTENANEFNTISGYSYYLADCKFTSPVVFIKSIGSYTIISLANGKVYKVSGNGGTGHSMYGIIDQSGNQFTLQSPNYYIGTDYFNGIPIIGLDYFSGIYFWRFKSGHFLKTTGLAGTGQTFLNIAFNLDGFQMYNASSTNYIVGSGNVFSSITDVFPVSIGGVDHVVLALNNLKLVKLAGAGGTGQNMYHMAQFPTYFRPLIGYDYVKGSQNIGCAYEKSATLKPAITAKEDAPVRDLPAKTEVEFSVYPNPFTDVLQLKTSGTDLKQVTVLSADGKVVYDTKGRGISSSLDLQQLNAGIYYVKVMFNDNTVKVEKVIKQ